MIFLPNFNVVLYTGNGRIGSIVATAAAKHLTPVTLEVRRHMQVFLNEVLISIT